jgi:dTDP-glucose 4,6-dehydratase
MAKILVTGSRGAVGRPLVKLLSQRGHEVWGADMMHSSDPNYRRCNVSELGQVQRLFEESGGFDYVYHAAAEFGRNNGEDFYETMWRANAIGTKHMLRLQERYRFRMIFFSSSEVYGDYPDLMTEDVLDQHPIRQMNDYAISKWVNELQVLNSADRFGTETVRVRLFNTYGPGEHYSPYRSVICVFTYHALHNLPYTVYLDHHRTSTYIHDCIQALANIVDNFKPGEVYNIAGDEYHDIKTLSDTILGYLGQDDRLVQYVRVEAHNTRDKKTNNEKASRDLGYKTTVGLQEGIQRTIEWQRGVYGK